MQVSEIVSIALLTAICLGVWLGRRKGKARFGASLSAARAEGHAEARAEIAAQLTQTVNVIAGNDLPNEVGRPEDGIISALRLIAVDEHSRSNAALGSSDDDDHYDVSSLGDITGMGRRLDTGIDGGELPALGNPRRVDQRSASCRLGSE